MANVEGRGLAIILPAPKALYCGTTTIVQECPPASPQKSKRGEAGVMREAIAYRIRPT